MSITSNLKLLKYISVLLILSLTHSVSGQVNLKVGYSFGYSNLEQTNSIFERFNVNNPQAEKSLSPVKSFHGIELGVRYKFKYFGIDLSLSSNSGSSETLNVFQSNGNLGNDKWRISIVNYAIGLENYLGTFGYGANIGIQRLKYKTDFDSSSGKKTVFNETAMSSKFYIMLEVPSNKIAFSLRPFISTTWKPYNIRDVETLLSPQSTLPEADFDQNVVVYGISLLFYNGPQNRY